jgi:hypothetical protein
MGNKPLYGTILAFVAFLAFVNSSKAAEVEVTNYKFDYKCLLCRWTSELIITYHRERAAPQDLFNVLSTLCSFLGDQDKVNI